MSRFIKYVACLVFVALCANLCGCSIPVRTGYDRKIGAYKSAPAQVTAKDNSGESGKPKPQPSGKKTSAGNVKQSASDKMAQENAPQAKPSTSLEQLVNTWIGTPYVYGGSSKSGTDCSGYVMQLYKAHYGISLPHKASMMYSDERGHSVSRGSLKEGDLVFFGSFWKIDHVGIYLDGDRFSHASSSKGVIISSLSNSYWRAKYQGARRFR